MSSKYIAGVLRSKAWETMKETVMEKKDKVGKKLARATGGRETLRIDCGSTIQDSPNLMKVVLQVNKQAKEGSLKSFLKASDRGTHTTVAEAIIDTTKAAGERVEDMVDQFDAASDSEDE